MTFNDLNKQAEKKLYAGDITSDFDKYTNWVGLSLSKNNENHINFNITQPFPLESNSIDSFQAEDVLEHIEYSKLAGIINEIYRILKPGALFRISVPDYNCDVLYKRSLYNYEGQIVFDPFGGGTFENPGHIWFPTYESFKDLLSKTTFNTHGDIKFLHYYLNKKDYTCNHIDYSKGFIKRTPDYDTRVQNPYRPMSLVVDLTKGV